VFPSAFLFLFVMGMSYPSFPLFPSPPPLDNCAYEVMSFLDFLSALSLAAFEASGLSATFLFLSRPRLRLSWAASPPLRLQLPGAVLCGFSRQQLPP